MIRSIELKNIKSIKNKKFDLRNLNLLLGLNGMGKSSFIQSLLLLKQSSNMHKQRLDLDGFYTNLGKTNDVFYQYNNKEPLSINIEFLSQKKINVLCNYKPEADYLTIENQINENISEESLFNDNFQYLNANRGEPSSLTKKNYTHVIDNKNVGIHGEYTAHFLENYGSEDVFFNNLIHDKSTIKDEITGKNVVNRSFINQVNLWMGEISPNVHVRTTSMSSDYVAVGFDFKQPNIGFTNRFKPENVGFGISYALPIVVTLLAARPGELVIIENPESHIHPRGQAELGKLIAKTAMNDVQIILETHSDHVLNGIRVAVKESDISRDKVIIFYFDKTITNSEQYSKIIEVMIDNNGELSDYPKNMLDEWANQIFKLM